MYYIKNCGIMIKKKICFLVLVEGIEILFKERTKGHGRVRIPEGTPPQPQTTLSLAGCLPSKSPSWRFLPNCSHYSCTPSHFREI